MGKCKNCGKTTYLTHWHSCEIEPKKEKEWQGLTNEEIIKMSDDAFEMIELIKGKTLIFDRHNFAKAIEQKLKEKNHG